MPKFEKIAHAGTIKICDSHPIPGGRVSYLRGGLIRLRIPFYYCVSHCHPLIPFVYQCVSM